MISYTIRRLLLIIPTLLVVTMIVFGVSRLIPGDIIDLMIQEQEFASNIDKEKLKIKLGLDVPVYVQYLRWMKGVVQGDFGKSLWSNRSVIAELKARLPVSLELGFLALIIGQIIALPVGIYSAVRQDTIGDYISRSVAILFVCIPAFWLGTMVWIYPSIWWNWSPAVGYVSLTEAPLQNLKMFIIPAIIMGLATSGTTMRMMRTTALEVLRQDYIRTAWSKGLRERLVIIRHALKNALIPVITIIGMMVPVLLGGTVIIETIFNLPGMGLLMIEALTTRDYNMLSGVNLFMAAFVLFNNLVIDLSYAFLDPRIHYK